MNVGVKPVIHLDCIEFGCRLCRVTTDLAPCTVELSAAAIGGPEVLGWFFSENNFNIFLVHLKRSVRRKILQNYFRRSREPDSAARSVFFRPTLVGGKWIAPWEIFCGHPCTSGWFLVSDGFILTLFEGDGKCAGVGKGMWKIGRPNNFHAVARNLNLYHWLQMLCIISLCKVIASYQVAGWV